MGVSVFANQAWGSAFILQVSINEAMTAQFSAPASNLVFGCFEGLAAYLVELLL